jgi:hypothetical protein
MHAIVVFLITAWLVTTNLVETVKDTGSGEWKVEHKQYCVEKKPTHNEHGELVVKDKEQEIKIKVDRYILKEVQNCP